jgi:TDG/mug DNA glycosylase family protein
VTRPTREQLLTFYDHTVQDLLPTQGNLKLLFVGINPGLWTAATQTHFAYPGNRFYPALHRAGITPHELSYVEGMTDEDRDLLCSLGIGISNVVPRATARADELTREELRAGGAALVANIAIWKPAVVAVAGITAYRAAFGLRKAVAGLQGEHPFGDVVCWVVPNPSGLNAHETVDTLAQKYGAAARAAGLG